MDFVAVTVRKTFAIYRQHLGLFLGISVSGQLLRLLLDVAHVFVMGVHLQKSRHGVLMIVSASQVGEWFFLVAIFMFGCAVYAWMQGATLFAITEIQLGSEPTADSALLRALRGIAGLIKHRC